MTIIYAKAQDQVLTATILPKLVCNNQNTVKLHVDFDTAWNIYTARSAVFNTSKDPTVYEAILTATGECIVPNEVLHEQCRLYIGVKGLNSASDAIKASTLISYKVLPGTPSLIVSDPTPTVYSQLASKSAVLEARMGALEKAGTIDGSEVIGIRTGSDGTVYTTAGDAVRGQLSKKANQTNVNCFYGLDIFTRGLTNLYPHGDVSMDYTGGVWKNVKSNSFPLPLGTYTMIIPNVIMGGSAYLEYVGGEENGTLRILKIREAGIYTFEVTRSDLELQFRVLVSNETEVPVGTYGIFGAIISKGIINVGEVIPRYLTGVDKKIDKKIGKNLFDKNSKDIVYNKYFWNDGTIDESESYYITGYIPIKPNTNYVLHDISFGGSHIVFYTENGTVISSIQGSAFNPDGTFISPDKAYFVRLTGRITDIDKNQLEEGTSKTAYEPYTEHRDLRDLALRVGVVEDKLASDLTGIKNITAETLSDGAYLKLIENLDVKKNKTEIFYADITSFSGVRIGHGETVYGGAYIDIDNVKATIYDYTSEAKIVKTQVHGLTISEFISVVIDVDTDATITISTASGSFTISDVAWAGCNGHIFAKSIGSVLTNCELKWTCSDLGSDVWVIGDSYLGLTNPSRFPYHLLALGFDNWLACGYPGAAAYAEKLSVANLLTMGTPKCIVWAIGMNNVDNGVINPSWLTETQSIIDMCVQRGITPILTTIPSTWDSNSELIRDNSYKNAWIKASGYRYVDFEKAVGAHKGGGWYAGMLSEDGVHPAELGAKALASRFIIDVPEITQKRNR